MGLMDGEQSGAQVVVGWVSVQVWVWARGLKYCGGKNVAAG